MAKLYYFHDPMCSWCYAFSAVLNAIETKLPDSIELIKVVTGLAPDSMTPMTTELQKTIQAHWKKIEQSVPNVSFNYDFWHKNTAIRSTYPACRAVLAAKNQSDDFENEMISQIQHAYYKNAENPALIEVLIKCAQRCDIDIPYFINDLMGQEIENELQKQIEFTRQLSVFSYPSLRLESNNTITPINIDYIDAESVTKQILLDAERVI